MTTYYPRPDPDPFYDYERNLPRITPAEDMDNWDPRSTGRDSSVDIMDDIYPGLRLVWQRRAWGALVGYIQGPGDRKAGAPGRKLYVIERETSRKTKAPRWEVHHWCGREDGQLGDGHRQLLYNKYVSRDRARARALAHFLRNEDECLSSPPYIQFPASGGTYRWGWRGGDGLPSAPRYQIEMDGDRFDLHYIERSTGRRRRIARYDTLEGARAGINRDWNEVLKNPNHAFVPKGMMI